MEYEIVSRADYKKCQDIAKDILAQAADYSGTTIQKLLSDSIINYFNFKFQPFIVGFYYPVKKAPPQVELINTFDKQFATHNIPLSANSIKFVDQTVITTVDGISENKYQRPTIFLNVSTNNFSRITFTCLHEFVHIYLKTNHLPKTSQLEVKINIITSLLLLPDLSLQDDMKILNFSQIQKKYRTSRSALFNRLRNYFYYTFEYDYYDAFLTAKEFEVDKRSTSYYHLMSLLYEEQI